MDKSEKEIVKEVFSSVQPYLNSPKDLESLIDELLEDEGSKIDLERKMAELVSKEDDPTTKADYRIFLNKLRDY